MTAILHFDFDRNSFAINYCLFLISTIAMAAHILIGVFMPILVFSILSYTCFHYIFTIQGTRNYVCLYR